MEHASPSFVPAASRKRQRLSAFDYTVACLVALDVELTPMRAMLDAIHDPPDLDLSATSIAYTYGEIGPHNIVLAVLPRIGNNDSAVVAQQVRNDFKSITFGLLVGIAGGVPDPGLQKDIRLGDVVVSDWTDVMPGVVQFDRGKYLVGGFARTGYLNQPPNLPLTTLKNLRSRHKQEENNIAALIADMFRSSPNLLEEYTAPGPEDDRLYDPEYEHAGGATCDSCEGSKTIVRPVRSHKQPQIHYGTIGSSNSVLRSGSERERLRKEIPGLLAVEMEAAGLMNCLPCIVIKGICDYADSHKNKKWQPYAALAASAYAKEFLKTMPGRRPIEVEQARFRRNSTLGTVTVGESVDRTLASDPKQLVYKTLFESLTFDRMDARLRNVQDALPGTCKWLLTLPPFYEWTERLNLPQNKGFLWIKGKPGCGKSTMMKATHAWAKKHWKMEIILSYFFNARAPGLLEKSSLGLYRSLTHQLLEVVGDTREDFIEIFRSKYRNGRVEDWSIEELQSFWIQIIEKLQNRCINIFVDALDEGNINDVRQIISFLEDLTDHAYDNDCRLRICLSSRHYPEVGLRNCLSLIMENEEGHGQDIKAYIKAKLRVDSQQEGNTLKQQLYGMSSKVFLWVALVIPLLNDNTYKGRPRERERCLEKLPKDLDGLFSQILTRNDTDLEYTEIMLRWLLFSQKPLNCKELYLATTLTEIVSNNISIDTGEDEDPPDSALERFVLDTSRGLAELTRSVPPVVQFIHESVRSFLLARGMQYVYTGDISDMPGKSHDLFAQVCLKYLASHALEVDENLVYSIPQWRRKNYSQALSTRFGFSKYASKYLFAHCECAQRLGVSQERMLGSLGLHCVTERTTDLLAWLRFRDCYQMFSLTTYRTLPPLLYLLAEQDAPELCTMRLAQAHDDPNETTHHRYRSVLQAACACGSETIARLLISHGADVNQAGGVYEHSLYAAMSSRSDCIVELLMLHGAQPPGDSLNIRFFEVIPRGTVVAVKTLLQFGASLTRHQQLGTTPLLYAINQDAQIETIHALLNAGADINERDADGDIPVVAAASKGSTDVVRLLVDNGALLNQRITARAFAGAVDAGSKDIIQLLLNEGVDPIIPVKTRFTSQFIGAPALPMKHTDVLRLPLNAGADASKIDTLFLERTAEKGLTDIVRLLLEAGADPNHKTLSLSSPLDAAVIKGHKGIAEFLSDAGAQYNAKGGHFSTALMNAINNGHLEIVRLLVRAGAGVNAS